MKKKNSPRHKLNTKDYENTRNKIEKLKFHKWKKELLEKCLIFRRFLLLTDYLDPQSFSTEKFPCASRMWRLYCFHRGILARSICQSTKWREKRRHRSASMRRRRPRLCVVCAEREQPATLPRKFVSNAVCVLSPGHLRCMKHKSDNPPSRDPLGWSACWVDLPLYESGWITQKIHSTMDTDRWFEQLSINQSINQSIHQSIDQSINQSMDGWMNRSLETPTC